MLCLLGYGVVMAFIQRPELMQELSHLSIRFRLPELTFGKFSWKELLSGFGNFRYSSSSINACMLLLGL